MDKKEKGPNKEESTSNSAKVEDIVHASDDAGDSEVSVTAGEINQGLEKSPVLIHLDSNQRKVAEEILQEKEEAIHENKDINPPEQQPLSNFIKSYCVPTVDLLASDSAEEQRHSDSYQEDSLSFVAQSQDIIATTTAPPEEDSTDSHYCVNIFEQAKQGNFLPWVYAISSNLIPIDSRDSEGYHLIHRATISGQLDMIIFLIEKAVVPCDLREEKSQLTALMIASRFGNIKIMKYLIDKGADVNAKDIRHFTPVMYCVMNQLKFHTIYLIGQGASIDCLELDGFNLAHRAAFNNDVEMLQIFSRLDKTLFDMTDELNLAPIGRAISNDAHQAFTFIQRVRPIRIPSRSFASLDNKCMVKLIEEEYDKQNQQPFTKSWVRAKYATRPADFAVLMYGVFIVILYFSFVQQMKTLIKQSENLHNLSNVTNALTLALIIQIYVFSWKTECPSKDVKAKAEQQKKHSLDFSKLNLEIVDFKFINAFFGDQSMERSIYIDDSGRQKRVGAMNLFDYVTALVVNEKFDKFKQLWTQEYCFECLKPRPARGTHCRKLEVCVEDYSHYSEVFGKLIIRGINRCHYLVIIVLQWTLLCCFFAANYFYCLITQTFTGWTIFALVEVPYLYYNSHYWSFFIAYLIAVFLIYIATVYLVIEVVAMANRVTRYELLEPQNCNYFYKNENIVELSANSLKTATNSNTKTTYARLYKNPF